jgi:hypothetical protein
MATSISPGGGEYASDMTVGGVFTEAFEYYTRFFRRFVATAAAVFLVLDLLAAIAADARGKSAGLAFVWAIVWAAASLVGSFWVQGALVLAVDDVRDGRIDTTIEQLYRRTRPFLGTLLAAGILAALGVALGLILFIVPGLFLLTRWALVVPIVVLEGRRTADAFRRSSQLVSGHGWKVFGVVVLTLLLAWVTSGVLITVFSFLPSFVAVWVGGLVAHCVVVPFVALAWTATYFELRRREHQPVSAAA